MYIMRKKYNCISVVNITKAITIALFVILPSLLIAQQSPSIQSGVTFQWSDTQNNLSDPATIESVTINGTMYNTFVVPTSYELTRLGPDGNGPNRIIRNGNNTGGNSNSANWNSRATDAFQDKNLNHYFFANPNGRNICLDFEAAETTDAQKQTIFYNPSIPSNEGGVLAVTERGGNNCFYIEIWGTPVGGGPEQKLGETFVRNVGDYRNNCAFGVPANGSDYWKSGRCNENGQTIGIGLFYLSDIAPIGSKITKIVFCAATRDHGDGKFFLLQKYAVDQQDTQCLNTTFTGDVRVANNAPENSTYNITSPPTVPGESFTFNSDGTFTYVPSAGFVGDVVFEYEVCLPEPNTSVCDQATVTLTYVPEPPSPEIDVSCSSTNNFMISVTTPLGEEYEYSLNNGTYQASPDFTNLSEGSYTLTVKNKYTTCEIEYPNNPFTLTNLELAGTTTDVICNPDTTGAIDITASGGAPPYSYSWSNGATTEDLTNIAAGTYTVTVSDSNDCPISKEFTINQPTSPLSSTISKIDVLCNGDNSGEIDLTIEGGTPPYSILWNTNSSSEDLSELAAGNYNVTITDANNCSTTNQTTIEQPATALSGTATNINNVDCSENLNGSFTIEASGSTSPYIYSIDNGNTNQSSSLFENLTAGSYTVLITDANGCTFTVNSEIDIDDTENPQISIPLAITIEGCSVSEINTTNALFEYSETQSADVQTIFESNSEYNTSDDSNIQSITYIDTVTSSDSCPITVDRTFTVTDNCGNSASAIQTITIQDTTAPNLSIPADVTIECSEEESSTNTGEATGSDTCSTVTITQSDDETSACGNTKTIVRTWTATDECGNTTSADQTIVVEDTTPPIITIPVDVTIECGEDESSENTGLAKAEDDCGGLTISESDDITETCGNTKIIIRTWTAVDNCGNSISDSQTITVVDTTSPTFTVPADITIECDIDATDLSITGDVTNEADNCDPDLEASFSDSVADGSCDNESTITRTWSLTDACDNITTLVQTINVMDTTAPTFTVPTDITIECDDDATDLSITGDVTDEADNCDTDLEATFSDSVADGSCDNESTITRTWSLTDACDNITTLVQTINVIDTTAPTFTVPTDITIECDDDATDLSITGDVTDEADNCDTDLEATFSDSVADGSCDNESTITRTWSLTDACDNITTLVQTINVMDTTAPTFTVPTDITIECDVDATDLSITGDVTDEADNCDTDLEATFSDSVANGSCDNESTITRTWSLTDACDNITTLVQTINVIDTTAPTINIPASNIIVECDPNNNGEIQDWLDNNGGATASDSCGNVTWSNDFNGTTSDCSNAIEVIFTATDECGNTTTTNASYSIQDTSAPNILTQGSDLTVECDGSGNTNGLNDWLANNGGAIANDDCSALIWSNDFTELTDECGATGSATVTFTATDACGNSETTIAVFSIEDTTAPTFNETIDAIIDVECNNVPAPETLTATDNCGTATVTFQEIRTDGSCSYQYVLARTWTATDSCGNQTVVTQTVKVKDSTAPTFTVPDDITIDCDIDPNDLTITGDVTNETDNCDAGLEATYSDSIAAGNCANESVISRTWSLTDACNNTTTLVQTINVIDTTAPTFNETIDAIIDVECNNVPAPETLTATDNCGTATVTFQEIRTDGSCSYQYVLARTWTATDSCGNQTVVTQTVKVKDSTAPTFTVPDDITIDCDIDPNDLTITGDVTNETDNCDAGLEATYSDSVAAGKCTHESVISRTWSLTDACNNTTTLVQTINVIDTIVPTFTVPNDITIECDVDATDLTITGDVTDEADNCDTDLEATYSDSVANGSCANELIITRTWSLTDACENSTTLVQTINIVDTTAPIIDTSANNIIVECDGTGNNSEIQDWVDSNGGATASDSCGNVTWNNNYNGVVSDCSNPIEVIFTATDECGNSSTTSATYSIQDTNAPNISTQASDLVVECDGSGNTAELNDWLTNYGGAIASEDCSILTWSNNFTELSDECGATGSATVTFTATDACGNSEITIGVFTIEDTTAPTFNEALPADVDVECDAVPTAETLTANDNCGDATVTFEETTTAGVCDNTYTLTRTWTATDSCGNETVHSQNINVTDTSAPTFNESLPVDIDVECDAVPTAETLTANDNCGDATVTFEETTTAGVCDNTYTLTRTWTATDSCGNETVHSQNINVTDTSAPTFNESLPVDIDVECDAVPTAETLTANDNCGDATVTFEETTTAGVCDNTYTLTRTWTATDSCGNETVHSQNINVTDTSAPTFNESLPVDIDVECDAVPTAEILTASDNCGDASIEFEEEIINGTCMGDFIITRTWTAIDSCNNETVHTQIITVQDTTAPTIVVPDGEDVAYDETITVSCDEIPEVPELVFEDTCSNDMEVTFNEDSTQTNDFEDYQIIRTWYVVDDCDNEAVFTQTINVEISNIINAFDASRCVLDSEFDLFDLLSGDFNMNGTWSVISGDASLNGSFFDPSDVEIGMYTFMYSITEGPCPKEVEVNVTIDDDCVVLACGKDDVIISKTVTANGDTFNDFFTVGGIDQCGFVIELQIFNRWGAKIYESRNYQNDWNGDAHGSSVGSSGKVPTGTYYYVINLRNSGLEPFAGPIYVATK